MASSRASTAPRPNRFSGDRFQILSLDGGGAKALFSASLLAHFEEDHGTRIVDHFDLIAGTSAGGIVALALGAGLSPAEISERYLELIARVFPARRQRKWRPDPLHRPRYSSLVLREVLEEVFGDRLLGQSHKRLLVPSWNVHSRQVHLFKTPHNDRLKRDWKIPMVDVALATSAAPTYFSAATVDSVKLIDGGIFANNPSVLAIGEARSMLGVPLEAMRVLSIGTMSPFTAHSDRLDNGGLWQWAGPATRTILEAGSASTNGLAMHLIGFDNFDRVDAEVPPDLFALDRIDKARVASYAAQVSRDKAPDVEDFFDHAAPLYSPPLGRGGPASSRSGEDH